MQNCTRDDCEKVRCSLDCNYMLCKKEAEGQGCQAGSRSCRRKRQGDDHGIIAQEAEQVGCEWIGRHGEWWVEQDGEDERIAEERKCLKVLNSNGVNGQERHSESITKLKSIENFDMGA